MRHRKKKKILDRNRDQRKMLLRNLATSLIKEGKIKTTLAKAKFLRPKIERLITTGKKGDLTARRRLLSFFQDEKIVKKILEEISPRYQERRGGYTRIVKIGRKRTDKAKMAIIELVQ
ncbi:MAG: 50S ribosomal protein L17 [Patescibacteria group bacterium]|nr:50S ribosomal protein L17 [Patescibacteria group bacterium]